MDAVERPADVVLGVLPGGVGPERHRVERVSELLRLRTVQVDGADDRRMTGCSAVLLADPEDAPDVARMAPGLPILAWLTASFLGGSSSWRHVASSAAVIVPSTTAARTAMAHGVPRSALHVVPHPLDTAPGPAFRPDVVEGVVGLLGPPPVSALLRDAIARSPLVRDVLELPAVPIAPDDDYWAGPGQGIERASVIAVAAVSVTGRVLASLMARGAPIVTWAAGAAPDAIVDGMSGWLVAPASPERFGWTVDRVLRDRWARETAGIAARDRALARHAPETAAALIAGIAERAVRHHEPLAS